MALFDMCVCHGVRVIAAHVNYQKRASALRDMKIVQTYCQQHGIVCEIRMQNKECKGNFQAFARDIRFSFFKELCEKYDADGVLLAHQLDDHIETYLMQKQQKRQASYYGIRARTRIQGCSIVRPLLGYRKQALENYCKQHCVPFGIDESNLSDDYTRNQIRHTQVARMRDDEIQRICEQIKEENEKWAALRQEAACFLASWDRDLKSLRVVSDALCEQVLVQDIMNTCHVCISYDQIVILRTLIQSKAKQWTSDIKKAYVIYNEYDKLCIDAKAAIRYAYVYDHIVYEATPYFDICTHGSQIQALTLQAQDFPITIRPFQEGDEIVMRFGTKKVNRWFIDRKITKKERKRWPIVVNAQGKVIFVPKLGCDIAHFSNNPTCFVVK